MPELGCQNNYNSCVDRFSMLAYVLLRLTYQTTLSLILAALVGSGIGVGVGAIRRRVQETVYVSRVGAFLGSILVCSVPPVSVPGALESWGSGGGLGSLGVLVCLFLVALGSIVGSLITSILGFKLVLKLGRKWLTWIIAGVYIFMVISLVHGYLQYCSPSLSYC
uniref:Uncharacterized protein n=1 Tax=Cyanothece sp. (strain PCC 7425 / ATCC 29141) TaxID=395961 RepID=B8HTE7_CYAP4